MGSEDFLADVRAAATKRMLFLPHALAQMNRPERMISTDEVRSAVSNGEIVEDYPEDPRGHSLLLGTGKDRGIHVVCSPKPEYLAIITTYAPSPEKWSTNLRRREE